MRNEVLGFLFDVLIKFLFFMQKGVEAKPPLSNTLLVQILNNKVIIQWPLGNKIDGIIISIWFNYYLDPHIKKNYHLHDPYSFIQILIQFL